MSLPKSQNHTKITDTKDRQERAIYAFTIVTVVFLPLSSIASIFGMNSSDVRDMDIGQWAYWATALPVTVGVIFLGLWFTGELDNARRRFVGGFERVNRGARVC
jgi:Mg2+ and Co2+ transporter CorA